MTPEELGSHVAEYARIREGLVAVAANLAEELRRLVHPVAAGAVVESRAKEVGSFAGKIFRKRKYAAPLRDITDLVGARVITEMTPEVDRVVERIRGRFAVDERHSVDKSQELRSAEFGYLSRHLVLVLGPDELGAASLPGSMRPLRVEVQVRTLLQHAWSAIGHDRLYKSGFKVPGRWERLAARIAAQLESVDADFVELATGLDAYRGEFGVYLGKEAIQQEREVVALVRRHAPDDPELVERDARLALSLGDWPGAVAAVGQFGGERTAGLWCCLGLARLGEAGGVAAEGARGAGVEEFRRALEQDAGCREALLLLARQVEPGDPTEAAALYGRVLRQDARDPRALAGALRLAVRQGGEETDLLVWTGLAQEAVRRCEAQIEVGMDLAQALRLRALFLLVADEPGGDALAAVAEAIVAGAHSPVLEELLLDLSALRGLGRRRPAVEAAWRVVSLARLARSADAANRERVDQWAGPALPIRGPVWILAGGCAPEAEPAVAAAAPLLEPIFPHYAGTVVSGGTRQGVGGLVGAAAGVYPGRWASLGYLPIGLKPSATVTPDPRYGELRRKEAGEAFSWNEPLHLWADLLRSGIAPGQVTVLGINGGPIAAFEYRLAAAIGARVGVLEDSGRAASALDLPSERRRFPRVLRLPADPATIRLFVDRQGAGLELPAEAVERLAQQAHEDYRKSVASRVEPSHEPWERLDETLKASNRDQVRRSVEVLRLGGFAVRRWTPESRVREFGSEEIEALAEAEHGRWVLERLESGWEQGPVKDVAARRSPHLVPWGQLTEQVKEWDRQAVRNLGKRLAEVGLEVVRARPGS